MRDRAGEAVDPEPPADQQPGHDDQLVERAGQLLADAVAEQAVDDPQHRAGQRRHRHHQALLGRIEPELAGDDRRQRPEHDPDHERDVEIEERGEQGRVVARLPEALVGVGIGAVRRWSSAHSLSLADNAKKPPRLVPGTRSGGFVATHDFDKFEAWLLPPLGAPRRR